MVPPILKDDQEGQLIDGKLRSAEWRARAARSKTTDSNRKDAAVRAPAEHDLYTPPTRYAGSVMIPADQLPLDPGGQQTLEEKQPRDARKHDDLARSVLREPHRASRRGDGRAISARSRGARRRRSRSRYRPILRTAGGKSASRSREADAGCGHRRPGDRRRSPASEVATASCFARFVSPPPPAASRSWHA